MAQLYNQSLLPVALKRLEIDQGDRYLGVRIAMNGTWTDEYKYRLHKHKVLGDTISSSSISRHQVYMIHSVQYKPAIYKICAKPVVNSLLPKMGFNRKMPRAVVFGPRALGGSEFIHLKTEQFALQLTYYVRCLTCQGLQNRENLHLTAAYQRFLGLTKQFFQTDPNTICYKPRNSKMTFLWTEIWKHDLRLISQTLWIPESQFKNDQGIMETVLKRQRERAGTSSAISDRMIRNTNTVRLYLRCTFLSDLVDPTAETLSIKDYIFDVSHPRQTTEVYPNQPRPSTAAITNWQFTIRAAFISGRRTVNIIMTPRIEDIEPPAIDTFQDFYSQQPQEISNIIGNGLTEVDEESTKKIAAGLAEDSPITIFGEGSVKDGRGTHATRLYLGAEYLDTDSCSIQSAAITSGDPESITSLRSETSSVLAGL